MIRFLLVILSFASSAAIAESCKVIDVTDGDKFNCFTNNDDLMEVRLVDIDAPELDQPFGDASRALLSKIISSEMVSLNVTDTDGQGRTVARVYRSDGLYVNAEQVRLGAAWVYQESLIDKSLLALELKAKNEQRGLWSLADYELIAPREWRNSKNASRTDNSGADEVSKSNQAIGGFNCKKLKWCGHMSCEEAYFQLSHCKNPNIDGDHDGIPCERQCR